MKRYFLLLAVSASLVVAQQPAPPAPRTLVADTLLDFSCQNFVGSINLVLVSTQFSFLRNIAVTNGAFSVQLYPGTYLVNIVSSVFNINRNETWTVPQSGSTQSLLMVGSPSASITCGTVGSPGPPGIPATITDQVTPGVAPTAGLTKVYTKLGKLCSLDPTSTENCTGIVAVPAAGLVRSNGTTFAAGLLSDILALTGSGGTAVTNFGLGTAATQPIAAFEVPISVSSPLLRTGNVVSLQMWGSGARPVASAGLGAVGNCAAWGTVGLTDAGAPCGAGGAGANSLGLYIVQTGANAPINAQALNLLPTGVIKVTNGSGVLSVVPGVASNYVKADGTSDAGPAGTVPQNQEWAPVVSGAGSTVISWAVGCDNTTLASKCTLGNPAGARFTLGTQTATLTSPLNVHIGTVRLCYKPDGTFANVCGNGTLQPSDVTLSTGNCLAGNTCATASASALEVWSKNVLNVAAASTFDAPIATWGLASTAITFPPLGGTGIVVTPGPQPIVSLAGGVAGTVVTVGPMTAGALVTSDGTTGVQTVSSTAKLDASGNITTPGSVAAGVGSPAPTLASGQFGSLLTASIVGRDGGGRITIGTGGAASGTVTFGTAWLINPPSCSCNNETVPAQACHPSAPTLTTVTFVGTFVVGDKVSFTCFGFS